MSCRMGSDGVRGDGEEGSRGLVLGCSNRRLPEGQAEGECVRRGGFGAARRVMLSCHILQYTVYNLVSF